MNTSTSISKELNDIQIEKERSNKELQWLFDYEYFDVLNSLKDVVSSALEFMRPSENAKEKNSKNTDDIRLHIESPKVLEGYVKFEYNEIVDSKIIIKHSKVNKGLSFKTSIEKNKPWKLYQLTNAYNHFKRAHKLIVNELDKNTDKETVKMFLSKIINIGSKILDIFLLNTGDISKTTQHEFIFNPPLPSNLNIQFEYTGKSFLTNVFISNLSKKKSLSDSDSVDLIQIQVPSKKIETIFDYVERMCKIANEFQDKIRSFMN